MLTNKNTGKLSLESIVSGGSNSYVAIYTDCATPSQKVAVKLSRTNARTIPRSTINPQYVAFAVVACDGWVLLMEKAMHTANDRIENVVTFTEFLVTIYREAVTKGVSLSDLKPSNIGFFELPAPQNNEVGEWRLLDHDMLTDPDDSGAISSFGPPPDEFGNDESWIAQTRWATLVTAAWPLMSCQQRIAVTAGNLDDRYATAVTAVSQNMTVHNLLTSVGIIELGLTT